MQFSKSTYYYQKKQQLDIEKDLKAKILSIYHENEGRYGYRRITAVLRRSLVINHKKVQRIMQELNLKSVTRPKKQGIYKMGRIGPIAKNHLDRQFTAKKPNQKWVTDVTEFNVNGEKLYLSPILDLYNQEIISYEMSQIYRYPMINKMLEKAISKLKKQGYKTDELMLHSDQGWQYQMIRYQQKLKDNGIQQSMSRKGNCHDNAVMENFFGILKSECFYTNQFDSIDSLKEEIHKYMKYYNKKRIKLKLKGLSPVEYRTQFSSL